MSWQLHQLQDLCAQVISGGTPPTARPEYYGGDIPWLRTQEVTFNRITDTEIKITEDGLTNSTAKWIPERSVIVAMYGNSAGRVAVNHIPLTTNQACCNLIIDAAKADYRFIYYKLLLDHEVLHQMAKGAAQNNLNARQIRSYSIRAPLVTEQVRIADILSAYDDLIENNRRRMALLEDAARQLYREWFVRLRFPGHEHIRITNGVPEEWATHILDDLCLIGRGASPRPIAAFMGGEVPWFKIGDATASESPFVFRTQEHVTDDGAQKSVMLQPGALILSNSATCGIPYFTAVPGCVHDGWLHFSEFERISQQFLYSFLWSKREELVSSVGDGSTQKNLNTAAVGRLKLALPRSDFLLTQFDEAVGPMFAMVLNLATQNQALRAARDVLLPRLMTGEISV